MIKHAFCIIAHKDLQTLNRLLAALDDERNDLFLFIDSKSSLCTDDIFRPKSSGLFFAESHSVHWGHISQIEAELKLFKLATRYGEYSYFHLISGQDMPLLSVDKLHQYFENVSLGTNFIGYGQGDEYDHGTFERIRYYVPFTRYLGNPNRLKKLFYGALRIGIVSLQKILRFVRPLPENIEFKRGCNWASLSVEFIKHLISKEKELLKFYRWTPCCDEVYKQTEAWNTHFKETLFNINDEFEGCMREIDWERGSPYIWRRSDYNQLAQSNRFFARKFDSDIDCEIVDLILEKII